MIIKAQYWIAKGWSLILAEPTRTHPPARPNPGDIIFSELNWADIWADLIFYWSEHAETFRADPNKTHDKIQIKNKISNPSQEPPASSKAPNEDLKDMDVLCTFKIKIESHGYIMGISKTSDYIQMIIKMPNVSQAPPASSICTKQD